MPLRQCLVMSVLYGDSHYLPAALFSSDLVSNVVVGVTGEFPEKILTSSHTDILLVFASSVDINRVKVQLECQSSWMGKPVHLKCKRPSGVELQKFGVMGALLPPTSNISKSQAKKGDVALELPFFSGQIPHAKDEVSFDQWLFAVETARFTSSPQALHNWIQRSVREPASSLLRSLGVGVSLDKILSSFKLAYGTVLSFDELMREFLNICQFATESVTDYAVRLEKVFALLKENYSDKFAMVDNAQHLRERFYRGLRPEIHQRLTPSYEDKKTPYEVLLRRARQLEEEYSPRRVVEAKGARDDPQMRNVIQTLKEIREQIEQREDPPPHPKKRWKGKYGCYHCGESGHWRKTCPQRPTRRGRHQLQHRGVKIPLKKDRRKFYLLMRRWHLLTPEDPRLLGKPSCLLDHNITTQIQ